MVARTQTRPEEWANAASHALGVLLAEAAWPWLAELAAQRAGRIGVLAMAVFVSMMALQYGISAVYHALPQGRAKLWARAADHAAIYLFIAGSATPFALGLLGGTAGAATCALIWTLALAASALALRFVPYSDNHGHFDLPWTLLMVTVIIAAVAVSAYLVYVLEIIKLRRTDSGP